MSKDPFEEFVEVYQFSEVTEVVVNIFDAVPLFVWLLVALFLIKVGNDALSGREQPPDDTVIDRRQTTGSSPSRERYSIHDELDDDPRTYEVPSESDEIVVKNEVDRSIMGLIKRLARMVRVGGSSDRQN